MAYNDLDSFERQTKKEKKNNEWQTYSFSYCNKITAYLCLKKDLKT